MYVAAMRLEAKLLRMNGVTHLKLNPDDTRRGLVPRSCNRIEIELRHVLREKMHFFTAPPTTKPVPDSSEPDPCTDGLGMRTDGLTNRTDEPSDRPDEPDGRTEEPDQIVKRARSKSVRISSLLVSLLSFCP